MRFKCSTLVLGSMLLIGAVGCGPDEVINSKNLQDIRADVGGTVVYALGDNEPLEGVTVTVVDRDGVEAVATTTSDGLWYLPDLLPGSYAERYELAGYETHVGSFSIEAGGENDVGNIYVSRGTVTLSELGISATVSGAVEAMMWDGDDLADGIAGISAVYSMATGGDIVVTLDLPLYNNDPVSLQDEAGTIDATANAAHTVYTFSEANLANLPLTADNNAFTRDTLRINGDSYTPIHGDRISIDATLRLNVEP